MQESWEFFLGLEVILIIAVKCNNFEKYWPQTNASNILTTLILFGLVILSHLWLCQVHKSSKLETVLRANLHRWENHHKMLDN